MGLKNPLHVNTMSLEDALYPLLKIYESAPQPMKTLAGRAFRALPSSLRHGDEYARFQRDAREVEFWDVGRIRQYQIQALRDSLIAAQKSPFYSRRFSECGVDAMKFESLEQLADYPLIQKQDVIDNREDMLNPECPASQRLLLTTAGSTGTPMAFYLQAGVSRAKEQAYLEAMWARVDYKPDARVAVLRGHAVTGRKSWYFDASRNWMIFSSAMLTEAMAAEYVKQINIFKPSFIHAYPSSAMLLAEHMAVRGIKIECEIKALLCGSEHMSLVDKSWLEKAYGTKVFRWFGHSERVVLAGEGRDNSGFYFCPTYGYVEFGRPSTDGLCEVIGTSFHNHVMPLVRYRTGDYVRLTRDGATRELSWPCVTEIAGRESEFVIASDGRRVPLTVVNMHDDCYDGWSTLQFHQAKPGEMEVCYVPGVGFQDDSILRIETRLLQCLGPGFALRFRAVTEVHRTEAGKRRWLVSTLNQREEN